jgi:hypothetical protein
MNLRSALLATALSLVASCQGCLGCGSPIDNESLNLVRACDSTPPLIEPPKLDILFVIDNSNSMAEEQVAVAREVTAFVDELKKGGGVPSDFNVGVVTTAVYLNGRLGSQTFVLNYPKQAGKLRPVPVDLADGGLDLDPPDGERLLVGTDPEFLSKFARVIRQGTTGSGQETPFEAVRLALLGDLSKTPLDGGGNQGFLRDDARLLVVVLTDEDDCSEKVSPPVSSMRMGGPPVVSVGDNGAVADCTVNEMSLTTVSEYHRLFTEQLRNDDGTPREVIWTAIAPVSIVNKSAQAFVDGTQVRNVDCPTSNQGGFRHRQMAELFDPTLTNLDSICRDSFRDTLITIAQLASVAQTIELKNIIDKNLMQFVITRKSGAQEICTESNGGIVSFVKSEDRNAWKVQFGNQCRRRADDQAVNVRMLCAT